jgi:hypothetical protein
MRRIAAGVLIVAFLAVLGDELVSIVVLSAALLAILSWLFKQLADHNF